MDRQMRGLFALVFRLVALGLRRVMPGHGDLVLLHNPKVRLVMVKMTTVTGALMRA